MIVNVSSSHGSSQHQVGRGKWTKLLPVPPVRAGEGTCTGRTGDVSAGTVESVCQDEVNNASKKVEPVWEHLRMM